MPRLPAVAAEPSRGRNCRWLLPFARVAQLVEQRTHKPLVGGSSPSPGTSFPAGPEQFRALPASEGGRVSSDPHRGPVSQKLAAGPIHGSTSCTADRSSPKSSTHRAPAKPEPFKSPRLSRGPTHTTSALAAPEPASRKSPVRSSTAQVSAIAHYDRARRTLCRFASRRSCRARPDPAAASPHGVEPHGLAEGPNPPLCSTACPPPTVAETALPTPLSQPALRPGSLRPMARIGHRQPASPRA